MEIKTPSIIELPDDALGEPLQRMSAKATGVRGSQLTQAEIEAAEEEAEAWARKANSC